MTMDHDDRTAGGAELRAALERLTRCVREGRSAAAEAAGAGEPALLRLAEAIDAALADRRKHDARAALEGARGGEDLVVVGQLLRETGGEIDKRLDFARTRLESVRNLAETLEGRLRTASEVLAELAGPPSERGRRAAISSSGAQAWRIVDAIDESIYGVASLTRLFASLAEGTTSSSLRAPPVIDVGELVASATPARVLCADGRMRDVEQRIAAHVVGSVDPEDLRVAIHHVLGWLRDVDAQVSADERPPIVVRVDAASGEARVAITDPALLLSADERATLLRADTGASWPRRGSRSRRIGLAIAADALSRNGGALTVDREETGGTRLGMRIAPTPEGNAGRG